jgi:hypothetical protein
VNLAVDAHGQVDPPQGSVVLSGSNTGVQEALLGGTEFAIAQTLDLNNGVTNASGPVVHISGTGWLLASAKARHKSTVVALPY